MLIQKFGGTSVGNPARMTQVLDIINDGQKKIVVLSAVAGTTNKLVAINQDLQNRNFSDCSQKLQTLQVEYTEFVNTLLSDSFANQAGHAICEKEFDQINDLIINEKVEALSEKIILSKGELISTQLFVLYAQNQGHKIGLLFALDFLFTNQNGDPDLEKTTKALTTKLTQESTYTYYVTQGYICTNAFGQVDNLQRGGSDYTATILGAALKATEIQIWTDIDGLHNNDPRIVQKTTPVRCLSYREAAELAYFGAKILHPTCVIPAEQTDTPIRLKNTFEPQAPGTMISSQSSGKAIAAIAAKDNITVINIRSARMLNAYGFLRKVFEVFEKHNTSIDMITTSEVSVSVTIDNTVNLDHIIQDIKQYADIHVENKQTIICIVGDNLNEANGTVAKITNALVEIPLRMVSYGGSSNNVSILVDSTYKNLALQSLHYKIFVEHGVGV
jgi:aspartate kinase